MSYYISTEQEQAKERYSRIIDPAEAQYMLFFSIDETLFGFATLAFTSLGSL